MSDAPAHHLFVLLPPVNENSKSLPDPLVVIQVCLEGEISRQTVLNSLSRGQRSAGDMIPWLVSQQFQDDDFASLSGARVVRIAAHPDYAKMGYGSRALELLTAFYQGDISDLAESAEADEEASLPRIDDDELEQADLKTDQVKVRDSSKMPPLLSKLSDKKATHLDYLGVSYGLTPSLHKFWKRAGYVPLYMRQTTNDLTGEHTCVMVKTLTKGDDGRVTNTAWLDAFARDFCRRFLHLLSFQFRDFTAISALSIVEAAKQGQTGEKDTSVLSRQTLSVFFSPYDLKRLESYSNNMLDYHVILDLIPTVADLYFRDEMASTVELSGVQAAILLGIGLQRKSVDDIGQELSLASNQVLALFVKIVRKMSKYFSEVESEAIALATPELKRKKMAAQDEGDGMTGQRDVNDEEAWRPLKDDLDTDLTEEGKKVIEGFQEKQREIIDSLDLTKYAVGGEDTDWAAAEAQVKAMASGKKPRSSVVSVKNEQSSKKRRAEETAKSMIEKEGKRMTHKLKSSKKTRRT